MTREEALKILDTIPTIGEQVDALEIAIEALTYQNLTKPNNTCDVDLISRQDAIEAVCDECEWERKCHEECQHIETLKSLPSAEAVPNNAVPSSLADVYKWERDIALSQLEEYGISFAEKKRDDLVKVVRCRDCDRGFSSPVCPIQSQGWAINKNTFYCAWGERREE